MTALADQACEACSSDDDPLTPTEYEPYLDDLDENVWRVVDEHHLKGTFTFDDFADALAFTNDVGALAEQEWHHPDIHLSWGEVVVEFYTHKIDGLNKTDFVMAAKLDRTYRDN